MNTTYTLAAFLSDEAVIARPLDVFASLFYVYTKCYLHVTLRHQSCSRSKVSGKQSNVKNVCVASYRQAPIEAQLNTYAHVRTHCVDGEVLCYTKEGTSMVKAKCSHAQRIH